MRHQIHRDLKWEWPKAEMLNYFLPYRQWAPSLSRFADLQINFEQEKIGLQNKTRKSEMVQ
jgi:hypothetical protein